MAPELATQMATIQADDEREENGGEQRNLEDMEIFDNLGEVNATDMVEGWEDMGEEEDPAQAGNDTGNMEEEDKQGRGDQAKDVVSYMQMAARSGPMTLFASHLARLQAHLESMTVTQRANIIKYMQGKLDKWREDWVLALDSVSRDRADRLWALLITYQGEPGCIEDKDARWAEARWTELVEMLRIDAVQMDGVGPFRLPGTLVEIEDSQTGGATSSGEAAAAGQVMVQRRPQGPWEPATRLEEEELARKDADDEQVRVQQQQHDEELWAAHQAAKARDWDDWAVDSEMNNPSSPRARPSKRYKIRVSVMDKDHNELDTADMEAEVDEGDVPVVTVAMQNVTAQNEGEVDRPEERTALEKAVTTKGEGKPEASDEDQAETELVEETEGNLDEMVNAELTDLGSILDTVMGREWSQLFVQRQVDEDMVVKRWGRAVLEVFEVNRAMVEMNKEIQGSGVMTSEADNGRELAKNEEREEGCEVGDDAPQGMSEGCGRHGPSMKDELRVRNMSEEGSEASSGAKVFPTREIVAGNRRGDEGEGSVADRNGGEVQDGSEPEQQQLMDTQLDVPLENIGAAMDVVEPAEMAAAGSTTEVAGNGS